LRKVYDVDVKSEPCTGRLNDAPGRGVGWGGDLRAEAFPGAKVEWKTTRDRDSYA